MITNLLIISMVGLIVGFILSVPAGGSISIVVFTNALSGRIRYCHRVIIGASFADFVYVFISIYGLTRLYSLYKPYIPYILLAGSVLVLYISVKIFRTKFALQDSPDSNLAEENDDTKNKNGFVTGIMLGFLNPGLFMSWMTSSFIVFTTLTSFGFNAGGLDKKMGHQLNEIKASKKDSGVKDTIAVLQVVPSEVLNQKTLRDPSMALSKNYPLLLSFFYSLCISTGSITWFYLMTFLLAKYRSKIQESTIHRTIRVLGGALFIIGLVFAFKGISLFF